MAALEKKLKENGVSIEEVDSEDEVPELEQLEAEELEKAKQEKQKEWLNDIIAKQEI